MPNPTLVTNGATTWQNDINNWRQQDADWLQARGILRWADAATRNAAPASYSADGTISFLTSVAGFVGRIAGADQRLFVANNMQLSVDTASAVNLKLTGGTVGVQLQSTKVSITGLTTAGTSFVAGPLSVTNTAINVVAADASQAAITKINGVNGAIQIAGTGGLTVNGPTLLQSTLNVTGASVLSALTVSGAAALNAGLTVAGGNIVGTLQGNVTGNITSSTSVIGNVTIAGGNLTGPATSGLVGFPTSGVNPVPGVVLQTTGTNRASIHDGSAFTAQIASVHVDTIAPVAQDYPEGCLWVQV